MPIFAFERKNLPEMNDFFNGLLSFFSGKHAHLQAEKQRIREEMKSEKKAIPDEDKLIAEKAVFEQIERLQLYQSADTILMYWATKDELPTHQTIERWSELKTILLPCVEGDKLLLKRYQKGGKMVQRRLGIWEPELNEIFTENIDLVIVPGIAFDLQKNRLGRGKGYYDRFFKKYKPSKIGVCFDCQLLNAVPVARHDKSMDIVVSPSRLIQ